MHGIYLTSIDLEDVRHFLPNGLRYRPRVPEMIDRYLEYFAANQNVTTFFVVGRVAREYPAMIRQIAAAGHELACHGDAHTQLDRLPRERFCDDLLRNREALLNAGAKTVVGYRAPTFSLTAEYHWVYPELQKLGFRYSSSILPGRVPLYCWPQFGRDPRKVDGVWEIPITVLPYPGFHIPFAGGVYFRVLPFFLIRREFLRCREDGRPVLGYLHPYDIDVGQERFMHPELNDNRVYNALMYYNRKRVFERLSKVLEIGFSVMRYDQYAERLG